MEGPTGAPRARRGVREGERLNPARRNRPDLTGPCARARTCAGVLPRNLPIQDAAVHLDRGADELVDLLGLQLLPLEAPGALLRQELGAQAARLEARVRIHLAQERDVVRDTCGGRVRARRHSPVQPLCSCTSHSCTCAPRARHPRARCQLLQTSVLARPLIT